MKPTPAQLDRVINAVRQHNSPLPWENDVTRANEKICELWTALDAVNAYCIPGMNWTDEVGQALLNLAVKALASAKKMEE